MCFSEKLSDVARAYQTANGWVYRAWKVIAVREDREKLRPLFQPTIQTDYGYTKAGPWGEYRPSELMRDKHGFHVAATPKNAIIAALQFVQYGEQKTRRVETALQALRRLERLLSDRSDSHCYQARLCRCLVPSESIGEGHHAHSMILLPPRQRENDQLIALADRENRRLRRSLNERDLALAKLREIAAGKAAANV